MSIISLYFVIFLYHTHYPTTGHDTETASRACQALSHIFGHATNSYVLTFSQGKITYDGSTFN